MIAVYLFAAIFAGWLPRRKLSDGIAAAIYAVAIARIAAFFS